jgi:hypothetical protein
VQRNGCAFFYAYICLKQKNMAASHNLLMSITYLGPVEYYARLLSANKIMLEREEHYFKQTYRNRCNIYTANGLQALSIPVIKVHGNHTRIKDIRIDYSGKWPSEHWRAILSAYSHAPYFLFYKDILEPFYFKQYDWLFEYNLQLMEQIFQVLEVEVKFLFSETYMHNPDDYTDLRNAIHPKQKSDKSFPPYIQVFAEKFGFVPNLSIIDLLFNEGPAAKSYLENI